MVRHSVVMAVIALAIIAAAGYGMSRVATGFLPIEDQGYLLAAVQLPDGAALGRTQATLQEVAQIAKETPGVDQVITIAGISALDNNSTLANAGVAYIMLKDWSLRGEGEDLLSLYKTLNAKLASSATAACWCCRRRRSRASATPPASPCRSSCATAASTSPSCRARSTRW